MIWCDIIQILSIGHICSILGQFSSHVSLVLLVLGNVIKVQYQQYHHDYQDYHQDHHHHDLTLKTV